MKLNDYTKEDFELMSYSEITELILTDAGKSLKIVDIFRKIKDLLGLSDKEFENKIADYFELISTDKKFIVLEKGFCDLSKKHTPDVVFEEETSEEIEPEEEETVEEEDSEDDIFYDTSNEDDLDDDDDLDDLVVINDDDEEASM